MDCVWTTPLFRRGKVPPVGEDKTPVNPKLTEKRKKHDKKHQLITFYKILELECSGVDKTDEVCIIEAYNKQQLTTK